MKLRELIKNLSIIEMNADAELEISGVSYDSRKTEKGDMFVAIRGFEADGHKFIPKAVENGAAVILCEEKPSCDIPYVLVSDSRYGLAIVSRDFFGDPASEMTMIGITGTSGKTSSSYLIKHMLESKLDAKVGLVGTNGNMIGNESSAHRAHDAGELRAAQALPPYGGFGLHACRDGGVLPLADT